MSADSLYYRNIRGNREKGKTTGSRGVWGGGGRGRKGTKGRLGSEGVRGWYIVWLLEYIVPYRYILSS